jgi:hypothetical protein
MIVSISRGRGLDQCEFRVPGQVPLSENSIRVRRRVFDLAAVPGCRWLE